MKNKIIRILTSVSLIFSQTLFAKDVSYPGEYDLNQNEVARMQLHRVGDVITFEYDGNYYQAKYVGKQTAENGVITFLIEDITPIASRPDSPDQKTGRSGGDTGVDAGVDSQVQTSFDISVSELSKEAFAGAMSAGVGTGIYLAFVPPSEQRNATDLRQQLAESYTKLREQAEQIAIARQEGTMAITKGALEILDQQIQNSQMTNDALKIDFASEYNLTLADGEFADRAEPLLSTLKAYRPKTTGQYNLKQVGIASIAAAESAYILNQQELADTLLDTAEIVANLLISANPFASFTVNAYELFAGKDLITGRKLSDWERAISGVAFATDLVSFGAASSTIKAAEAIIEIFSKLRRVGFGPAAKLIDAAEGTSFVLAHSTPVRKVNLRSTINPKWGLTKKHIEKHFFEHPEYALKNIDPKGNPDQWMGNISQLFQQPVVKIYKNGVEEIVGTFKKATGEDYKIGIRVFKKGDGSYDLVTVLTDQSKM